MENCNGTATVSSDPARSQLPGTGRQTPAFCLDPGQHHAADLAGLGSTLERGPDGKRVGQRQGPAGRRPLPGRRAEKHRAVARTPGAMVAQGRTPRSAHPGRRPRLPATGVGRVVAVVHRGRTRRRSTAPAGWQPTNPAPETLGVGRQRHRLERQTAGFQFGRQGGGHGGFGGGADFGDIFGDVFGDIFGGRGGGFGGGFGGFSGFGGGGSQQRRYRGSDLRVKVKLTLKEISTGVEKKFKLKKYVPCDQCHGTGAEGDGGSETCPTCKGSGSVIRNQQTILGTMQTRVTCSTCGGEGKIIKNKCKKCGGDGIIYGEEVVSVKIPAGVAEGMQLSMGGKGNAGKHNGVAGDLLILVEEEPHQDLIRDENDLIYNLLLSFPTAALGGAVEIPTIDGKVKVKIDSGTQPGKVLRLRGKGLPNVNGYGTGDLLVNISIYVPEALNKEEKSTLEKMEASDNFKPNTSVKEKIFKKFKSFFD